MKLERIPAALLVAALAVAAATPSVAKPKEKPTPASVIRGSCATIESTLGKVTDPREKGRWSGLLDMWSFAAAKNAVLADINFAALDSTLREQNGRVAPLLESSPKDRWESDLGLWENVIAAKGDVSQMPAAPVRKWYGMMQTHTAKIKDSGEMKRWKADLAMWAAVLPESLSTPAKH